MLMPYADSKEMTISKSLNNLKSGGASRQQVGSRYNFRQIITETPEYSERAPPKLEDKYLSHNRNESINRTEASELD